jgi:hypothetical protein
MNLENAKDLEHQKKDQLKQKILQFVKISQEGCERQVCLREFCKKNPGRGGL